MLKLKQGLKCCRQDRIQNAEVKTGVENIQFVSPRIPWFRRKMNDERMISQTPTVHKLDEVSSWCLADCSKYERVSEEESVKKSECGFSCWLVLPAARKRRERMYALSYWLAYPAASQWGSE